MGCDVQSLRCTVRHSIATPVNLIHGWLNLIFKWGGTTVLDHDEWLICLYDMNGYICTPTKHCHKLIR